MLLLDVNVLIYAHRRESPEHSAYALWLESVAKAAEPFALSEIALSGFLRIVTSRRIFLEPTPLEVGLQFLEELRARPFCRVLRPGERHWDLFIALCREAKATGNLVADAYHAALALEQGCEWVTTDGDFGRFPKLRTRHPLRPTS
jgi:toxin-antitoxin system PIN domain toxin